MPNGTALREAIAEFEAELDLAAATGIPQSKMLELRERLAMLKAKCGVESAKEGDAGSRRSALVESALFVDAPKMLHRLL